MPFHRDIFNERFLNSVSFVSVQSRPGECWRIYGLIWPVNPLAEIAPLLNGHIDWTMIGQASWIEAELTAELKKAAPAKVCCNHPLARRTTRGRRATAKVKGSPDQSRSRQNPAFASSTRKSQTAAIKVLFVLPGQLVHPLPSIGSKLAFFQRLPWRVTDAAAGAGMVI
ncbi:hypothetical protein ACFVTJ_23270 [Agrobacterium sp. NPDC058088]|uniref:hypothetical protein n=1 Tax=Agrobacterium sp. NPDC058088 TaxID=3346335 RepID=UPI0036D98D05